MRTQKKKIGNQVERSEKLDSSYIKQVLVLIIDNTRRELSMSNNWASWIISEAVEPISLSGGRQDDHWESKMFHYDRWFCAPIATLFAENVAINLKIGKNKNLSELLSESFLSFLEVVKSVLFNEEGIKDIEEIENLLIPKLKNTLTKKGFKL